MYGSLFLIQNRRRESGFFFSLLLTATDLPYLTILLKKLELWGISLQDCKENYRIWSLYLKFARKITEFGVYILSSNYI